MRLRSCGLLLIGASQSGSYIRAVFIVGAGSGESFSAQLCFRKRRPKSLCL